MLELLCDATLVVSVHVRSLLRDWWMQRGVWRSRLEVVMDSHHCVRMAVFCDEALVTGIVSLEYKLFQRLKL